MRISDWSSDVCSSDLSLTVEAIRAGEIDGFIAGEPWGSAAVDAGLAEGVAIGERIWRRGVEKVLAFRTPWLEENPDSVDRLLRALVRAGAWCDDPDHHEALAHRLSQPQDRKSVVEGKRRG